MQIEWQLFILTIAASSVVTVRQRLSPVTVALWLFTGVVLLIALNPLHLTAMNRDAASIVAAGLISLSLPAVFAKSSKAQISPSVDGGYTAPSAYGRFVCVSVVVIAMVLIGYRTFIITISAATGYQFDQLTLIQIRAAQNGAARGGGVLSLFAAAGPLLACLGVYGALRFSRWWFVMTLLATAISLQSPSRLNSIGSIVTLVAFWLYLRHRRRESSTRRAQRIRQVLLPIAGLISALIVFNNVGASLGKNEFAQSIFQSYSWPMWSLSPVLYFSGGLSALSTALASSIDPFEQGSSYYAILRVAEFLGLRVVAPDTIGGYVGIPMPFNLYTGFGQIFFDLGMTGVVIFCIALSWLAIKSHRRALLGSVSAGWIAAVASNVLLSMPLGFIALNLDILFRLVLGTWAFWFIRPRSGGGGHRNTGHTPGTTRRQKAQLHRGGPTHSADRAPSGRSELEGFR